MPIVDNLSPQTSSQSGQANIHADNTRSQPTADGIDTKQQSQTPAGTDSLITTTAWGIATPVMLNDYTLADVQAANRQVMTVAPSDLPFLDVTGLNFQNRWGSEINLTGASINNGSDTFTSQAFADVAPSADRLADASAVQNNKQPTDLATRISENQEEIEKLRKLPNRTAEQNRQLSLLQTELAREVQEAVARKRQLVEKEVGNKLTAAEVKEDDNLSTVLRTERKRRLEQLVDSAPKLTDAGGAANKNSRGGDNTQNYIYRALVDSMDQPMKALNGRSPRQAGYTLIPTRAGSNLDESGFDFMLVASNGTVFPLDASQRQKTDLPELRQKGVIVSDPNDPSLPIDDLNRKAARRESIRAQFEGVFRYLKEHPSWLSLEELRLPSAGSPNQESPTNDIDRKIADIRRNQNPETRLQQAHQMWQQLDDRRQEIRNYIDDLRKLGDHLARTDDLEDAKRVREYADHLSGGRAGRDGRGGPLGFLDGKMRDLFAVEQRAQSELKSKKPSDTKSDKSGVAFYDDHIDDPADLEGLWNPKNKLSPEEKRQTASDIGNSPSVLASGDAQNYFFLHTEGAIASLPSLQQQGRDGEDKALDVSRSYGDFRIATMIAAQSIAKPGEDVQQLAKKLQDDVKKNPDELEPKEREALKGPRELYQKWVDARDQFATESKGLKDELEVRRQAVQQRINDFNQENHLPPVELVLNQTPSADGLYRRGKGIVEIPPESLYDADSYQKVVPTIYHELVHNEQDALVTRNIIDDFARERNLDNDALSKPENVAEIQRMFLERAKVPLTEERLQQVLALRNGEFLNADEARKAQALEQSFAKGKGLPEDFSLSANDYRMCKRDLTQINDTTHFPDAGKDIMYELIENSYMRNHLFGTDEFQSLPPAVRDYAIKAQKARDGDGEWSAADETGARKLLADTLQQRIQEINDYRRKTWSEYRDNLHEREAAWITEDMSTTVRENSELIAALRGTIPRETDEPRTNSERANKQSKNPPAADELADLDLRGEVDPAPPVADRRNPRIEPSTEFRQTAGGGEQVISVSTPTPAERERRDTMNSEEIAKLEDSIIMDKTIPADVKANSVAALELARDPANAAARRAVREARADCEGGRAAEIEGAGMGIAAVALMLGEWYLQSQNGRSSSGSNHDSVGRYH